jgi:2-isopropylmalate synthase
MPATSELNSGTTPDTAIYDTTLRDGTQRFGLSLSCNDKLRIARRLDRIGVAYIEGGWPGSNPKDAEFFARARDTEWQTTRVAAFGATRRVGVAVEDDPNLQALLAADTPVCTIFGKAWLLHVTEVLRTTADENLRLIEQSVVYLKAHGREVIFDAEHFFDGYHDDPAYAIETLRAARRGGAQTVVLCETNGGALPWEVERVVGEVKAALADSFGGDGVVGIHTHNDSGCAVANAIAAVRAGARHVQGTINGYGERCGNANLCEVIPNLELKAERTCLPADGLGQLRELSQLVAEVANQPQDDYMPYVGRNAFAHKGGVHVAAMRRNADSYQHVPPEAVGNKMRVVVSELSGRGNLMSKVEEFHLRVSSAGDVTDVLRELKEKEARGFSYEAAEASVALMLARQSPDYCPLFRLVDYTCTVEHRERRGTFAEATVKVEVDGEVMHTAAEGDGPVSALDRALRKALTPTYPVLERIKLFDYKVRILDGNNATSAITRVLIDTSDGEQKWGTVGASQNIVDASWQALADAVEYGLRLHVKEEAPPVEKKKAAQG